MTREKFTENFKLLLIHLREVTEKLCFNKISENFAFILEPSDRNFSDHLTEEENAYLKKLNDFESKEITFDQVIDLFYKNGKTPKWADCSVYFSSSDKTIVKIYFSRQFKFEEEIYYLERGTGPFKAVVETQFAQNLTEKFDVNWKARLDKNKKKNIFSKLKLLWSK